jgi:hypothetical protein
LEIGEIEVMATAARWIWLRRNTVVFDTMFQHLNHIVIAMRETVKSFYAAEQQNVNKELRLLDSGVICWAAPPCRAFKINWNATIDQIRKLMSVSVIVRDYEGKVLATMCYSRKFITDPAVAEAYAVWKAMVLSREMGCCINIL